jgi:hypothetical protein
VVDDPFVVLDDPVVVVFDEPEPEVVLCGWRRSVRPACRSSRRFVRAVRRS